MLDLEELARLQKEQQEAEQQAQRAQGALEQLLTRLEQEFGCSSLEEGKRLLAELEAQEQELTQQFNQELEHVNTCLTTARSQTTKP